MRRRSVRAAIPPVLISGRRATADGPRQIGFGVATGDMHGPDLAYGGLAAPGCQVTARAPFQAASCSKTVAALALMTLVRYGLVDLDPPVNEDIARRRLSEHVATFI
jgi:CubicO group peptidase (beta-lactamase class C family)